MQVTSLQQLRRRKPRGRGVELARARLISPAMKKLVRQIGRRLARIVALLPMKLTKLQIDLHIATTLHPLLIMTTWAEKFLGLEVVALDVVVLNVVVLDEAVSTEEAGASDSIRRNVRRHTSATMLTTRLATATGTCLITVAIMTNTSPRISTDIQEAEV